jgi:hypothetical protein
MAAPAEKMALDISKLSLQQLNTLKDELEQVVNPSQPIVCTHRS